MTLSESKLRRIDKQDAEQVKSPTDSKEKVLATIKHNHKS